MDRKDAERIRIVFKRPVGYIEAEERYRELSQQNPWSLEWLGASVCFLEYNPSNYTLWVERRERLSRIIEKEAYSYEEELQWIVELAEDNLKNYQVWHHLGHVVQVLKHNILQDPSFFRLAALDPKNMHFWGVFLVAVLSHCSLLQGFEYTTRFIEEDIRNNSAFAIRHTILARMKESGPIDVLVDKEKSFLITHTRLRKNQAFWHYAKALDKLCPGLDVFQACSNLVQKQEIPEYYED